MMTYTTACRFMWILQDQEGEEVRHSAGIGGIPEDMKREARERGLEIWAEHYGLIGRVGQELGFVPLDNDAHFMEVKMPPRPEYGRTTRTHYWLNYDWFKQLCSDESDPWALEERRCQAYAREFLVDYLARTRTETFRGRLHDVEDWLIARGYPQLSDHMWEHAVNGGVAEWPGRSGELSEYAVTRA